MPPQLVDDTFLSDPPKSTELVRIHEAMRRVGVESTHLEIATPNGHDAFLVDYPLITPPIRDFLAGLSSSDS